MCRRPDGEYLRDPPADLVCPITRELFRCPVTAEDGKVYERAAILEWLKRNPTSPLTRQAMRADPPALETDRELQDRASAWHLENSITIQLFVELTSGPTWTVRVAKDGSCTIECVKLMLEEKVWMPAAAQILTYYEKRLGDQNKLADYYIA